MRHFNKFGAKKTKIDGITFASKAESERYTYLKYLKLAKEISFLELQPAFIIQDGFSLNGKKYRVIKYFADFKYIKNGKTIIEDVKGMTPQVYLLKRKMFLKRYGESVCFREVKKNKKSWIIKQFSS